MDGEVIIEGASLTRKRKKFKMDQNKDRPSAREFQILKNALLTVMRLPIGATIDARIAAAGNNALEIIGFDQADLLPAPVSLEEDESVKAAAEAVAAQEAVRQALREANNVGDLEKSIAAARELGLDFEVSLGERKLTKLKSSVPSDVTIVHE